LAPVVQAGIWQAAAELTMVPVLRGTHDALVDPALLLTLDVGDSLRIGGAPFRIAASLTKGPVAGRTRVTLGSIAAWAMSRWVFKVPFRLPVLALIVLWARLAGLAMLVGTLNSRWMFGRATLAALREAGE
jgi:predicted lysophospholipase L1 biosynthesis ABC-type transport system permease subunit